MMYLTEPKFFDMIIRQFRFKMNANAAAFTTLIILQVVLLFTSISGGSSLDYDTLQLYEQSLSNDAVVVATLFWACILGFLLTSEVQRNESFTFVTNRLSYHVTNFLFMLTASIIGGATAFLTGSVAKLYAILQFEDIIVGTSGLLAAPSDFFIRLATAIAFTLLFFMASYTFGMFIQLNKIFFFLFLIGWIALTVIESTWAIFPLIQSIFEFFWYEHSITIFLLKVSGTVLGLFAISIIVTNRLEVKK